MLNKNARALLFVACAFLYPLRSAALDSMGATYRNTRSAVDSGGTRKTSANFRVDGAAGQITTLSASSARYSNRDGLMGIDYYPARATGFWGSTAAVPGGIYLQWIAPGDDGVDPSSAGSFIVRYATSAAADPSLSDALFNAATNVPTVPPAPSVEGTLTTMTVTGLPYGATYYFAVKTAERDGLRSVLSAGVAVHIQDIWPPAPVKDLTAVAGLEGQMTLKWTAPDSNDNLFTTSSAASGYQIRIATFSVSGFTVSGSTTAWWNSAMDVTALPAPAISTAPPTPLFPGTTQSLLLKQLWPGVTYYAMIISTDEVGNVSDADLHSIPPAVQASTLIFDAPPPAPRNLAVAVASPSSFLVSWSTVTVFDLDYYKVYYDSTPPYDFSHALTSIATAPATTDLIANLKEGVTYIVKVTAVDRGEPRYPGIALESVSLSSVMISMPIYYAQAPYGVRLSSASYGFSQSSATVSWLPVVRYADLQPFAVSTAATSDQLAGYSVYRATTPILASWTDVANVSSGTLSWTDADSGPQYYYCVRAFNNSSVSAHSLILTPASGSAYAVAPDDMSFYEFVPADASQISGNGWNPDSAYLINVSTRGQDLGAMDGRVMQSMEFDPYMGGAVLEPGWSLSTPGMLSLHYDVNASSLVTPSFAARDVAAAPSNMSVFWFNGTNWVQLYGKLDAISQTVTITTKFFGRYQLRTAERTGGFAFNMAGVSNRILTPNGDKKNDNVVFTFDNPNNSAITAQIFDMSGRVVASSLPQGPVSNSLMWDGTAGGRPVSGGVYIYQIKAEGQAYSGTLVVIK